MWIAIGLLSLAAAGFGGFAFWERGNHAETVAKLESTIKGRDERITGLETAAQVVVAQNGVNYARAEKLDRSLRAVDREWLGADGVLASRLRQYCAAEDPANANAGNSSGVSSASGRIRSGDTQSNTSIVRQGIDSTAADCAAAARGADRLGQGLVDAIKWADEQKAIADRFNARTTP